MVRSTRTDSVAVWLGAAAAVACAPTLDWREARLGELGVRAMFPCRPSSQTRQISLAGTTTRWTMHTCDAGGSTWVLAGADVTDPTRVTAALLALAAAAQRNVGAPATAGQAAAVPGATPNEAARRLRLRGRLPDGQEALEQVQLFAHGTKVFQATVLGVAAPEDAVELFLASVRVGP